MKPKLKSPSPKRIPKPPARVKKHPKLLPPKLPAHSSNELKLAWIQEMLYWVAERPSTPAFVEWSKWARIRVVQLKEENVRKQLAHAFA